MLGEELQKPYMVKLFAFLEKEYAGNIPIYPPKEQIFNAFSMTPFDEVRVVIVGQDPYHGPGQAHGLCFSVPEDVPLPPSLKNIFKEIQVDLGLSVPENGCLEHWARQGVLLLNTTLTVSQGKPLSHHRRGWEQFTDVVLEKLANRKEPVVFVLWGNNAIKKCSSIAHLNNHPQHLVLTAAHPSPLSARRGFFGSHHFSKINQFLKKPINWQLNPK